MSTTSAYGWNIPDNTDLVKDGALAIRTLGNAIDTSMNTALGTKKAGMVLLNTTSFSGVSSQSINDVFNATYDNYKILINLSTVSSTGSLQMRLRVGGVDNTGATSYQRSGYRSEPGGLTNSTSASTLWFLSQLTSGYSFKMPMEILDPFKTVGTIAYLTSFDQASNYSYGLNMTHIDSTSYTGFTLIPSAGTITGNVSVYGYNK